MQDEREFSTRFARFITEKNVEKMMELFSRSKEQIRQNGNAKIVFFYLCLEIIVLIKQK
jgi:DNA polymerase-3 subunit delta'